MFQEERITCACLEVSCGIVAARDEDVVPGTILNGLVEVNNLDEPENC